MYAAIALVSLRILADSEPSLVDNAISNRVKLLCTGIIFFVYLVPVNNFSVMSGTGLPVLNQY